MSTQSSANKVAYPYPPSNPVIKRLILVDSLIFNFCINQSVNIINKRIAAIKTDIRNSFTNKIIAKGCPIKTPVHRAHTGSCLPQTKKLLSAL